MKKAVTRIGGADGPTSIFLCGKERNPVKRMRNRLRLWKQGKRCREAARQIADWGLPPHTIEETLGYIREKYQAAEMDADSCSLYEERKKSLRFSLIQRRQPSLLGEVMPVRPLKDLSDEQEVLRWEREIRHQTEEMERRAAAVPKEAFPMDYHLYVIDRGEDGQLEVETEMIHQELGCSYAGRKEALEPILRDIYLYYGVSREDISRKTERYRMLELTLSM